mgnify:FL=1
MTVDTRENGKVLPELPGQRMTIRYDKITLIFPKMEKVNNKQEYILQYADKLTDTRKRHG